jgi:starch synthase
MRPALKSGTSLNILFATPECGPWVKTGGLGDVCGSLPKALAVAGHQVRVLIPALPALAPLMAKADAVLPLPAWGPWPASRLLLVREAGITLWLLDCPALYDRPGGPYLDHTGRDFADNAQRFGLLSAVAARLSDADSPCANWRVDVLHCHDWTTALAPAYLRQAGGARRAGTVVTIHNLLFQGVFPTHLARALGLPDAWLSVEDGLLHWDQLCFLKAGLRFADKLTTVSPTYAREIQGEREGCGLDGMLRLRGADLTGILNGIDAQTWNPAGDTLIPATYDAETLERKSLNKQALQQRMALKADKDAMLLGLVSRLTTQKGIDLVVEAWPALRDMGCQLCLLGAGDRALEQAVEELAATHPGQVAVRIGFDESLAHLIEAGSDAFLMPSVFEPCGLNQMYSQAYGTPPIVHAVGGLADSVRDDASGDGNGFVFHAPTTAGLLGAVTRAHQAFANPARWRRVQRNAMALDNSWARSATHYVAVYREAIEAAVSSP